MLLILNTSRNLSPGSQLPGRPEPASVQTTEHPVVKGSDIKVRLAVNADIRKNILYQGLLILRQMRFCGQRCESRVDHALS